MSTLQHTILPHANSVYSPSVLWRFFLVSAMLGHCLTQAFQCPSCAYNFSPDDPDADDACVNLPEVFTGSQILKCENSCIVQETYNRRLQRVVGYWRSCVERPETGYCSGQPGDEIQTCVYTCRGDLCTSWARGQLHVVYAGVKPPTGNNSKRSTCGCLLWFMFFASMIILFFDFV